MDIESANETVADRILRSQPVLVGVAPAADVIPGMQPNLILHAGPPIDWPRMSGPLRGAVIGGLIFEGLAADEHSAVAMVEAGAVAFAPCHHYQTVGPMAGVTTASMPVYVIENRAYGNRAFSNLNEGYGKVLRYGAYGEDVLTRLRWLRDVFAPSAHRALEHLGGLDMKNMIAQQIQMGDEGHNRNRAGSAMFARVLAPHLAHIASGEPLASVLAYLAENDLAILNPVMAACKATMDAAAGVEGSTVVTCMARNGTDFGIRVSGLGERWFTAPAEVPVGLFFPGFSQADANPDIGDSTITETAGIGAFAMAAAPAIVKFVGGSPAMALESTLEMYEITVTENPAYGIPQLDFRGTPTGIDVRKVIKTGITPRVNTGIAHHQPGIGQVGAGLVRPPLACFEQALEAFAERYLP
ncbi:MAG TPA: DUF1116 domain-containing protein [bacterium]|nr:DUF1116 domain-containing protein [bacterium]